MTAIKIRIADLRFASEQGLLNDQQVKPLWETLAARSDAQDKFNFPTVALYGGSLLLSLGMAWLLLWSIIDWDGSVLFFLSFMYFVLFYTLGLLIWFRPFHLGGLERVPQAVGGVLLTLGVFMVGLIVLGIQMWAGWFIPNTTPFIVMESVTLFVGVITILLVRGFPLLLAPIFFSLWAMLTIDLENAIFGDYMITDNLARPILSLLYGAAILAAAQLILLWHRKRLGFELIGPATTFSSDQDVEDTMKLVEDYAFWAFIFGTLAFWEGLTGLFLQWGWLATLFYCFLNTGLLVAAFYLRRVVLLVFGALGVFISALDLLVSSFGGLPWVVAILISIAGLIVIGLGVFIHYYWFQTRRVGYDEIEDAEGTTIYMERTVDKTVPYGQELDALSPPPSRGQFV